MKVFSFRFQQEGENLNSKWHYNKEYLQNYLMVSVGGFSWPGHKAPLSLIFLSVETIENRDTGNRR